MKINFITDKPYKTLTVSHNLTGKMAGMPAITTSLLCNENCKKLFVNLKNLLCVCNFCCIMKTDNTEEV